MTNYNERLDKMLRSLAHQAYITAHAPGYTKLDGRTYETAVDEAKQAIASLTKEMVAEAKPEIKAPHPLEHVTLADCQRGLNHYEANLLKALDEV